MAQLTDEVMHEEQFARRTAGTMRGIVRDPLRGTLWLYGYVLLPGILCFAYSAGCLIVACGVFVVDDGFS